MGGKKFSRDQNILQFTLFGLPIYPDSHGKLYDFSSHNKT